MGESEASKAVPDATTAAVRATSCEASKIGDGQIRAAVGRRQSWGLPPTAVIRADTSPNSVLPVKVTEKLGLVPVEATERLSRFTIPFVIGTFTHPEMVAPEEFLTVRTAELYAKVALSAKDFQPCKAEELSHAMRSGSAPASKIAVGAGSAQFPIFPVQAS